MKSRSTYGVFQFNESFFYFGIGRTTTQIFLHTSLHTIIIAVATVITPPFVILVCSLFLHIFYNLRVSMRHTSEMTRRLQKSAAVTVLLLVHDACVPSLAANYRQSFPASFSSFPFMVVLQWQSSAHFLLVKRNFDFSNFPNLGELLFFLEAFEQPAVSAALFAFSNTHSIANSLTIVGRSAKYRKIIAVPFVIIFPCLRRNRQSVVHAWDSRTT